MITTEQAINLLESAYNFEIKKGGRGCGKTSFRTALLMGVNALGAIEQIRWERDVAISQLEELGLGLGQKVDHVKEAIEKSISMKPNEVEGIYEITKLVCPRCGNDLLGEYCCECGQRIDCE